MAKVFVNHVDSYIGQTLSKLLAESIVGASANEDEEDEEEEDTPKEGEKFQVIGTLQSTSSAKPKWVSEIVENDPEKLNAAVLSSDFVVYNIADDKDQMQQALAVTQMMSEKSESFTSKKVLVCLSSVLTWAKTKPADPEDPDVPISEDEYRRRRPHNHFRDHCDAEKQILKLSRKMPNFKSYTIAAGLPYGGPEGVFHYLFKAAWELKVQEVPLIGDGTNSLPVIHVKDLANIVVNVLDAPPSTKYIVAIDESQITLADLTQAVATTLGKSKVKPISQQEGFLLDTISQSQHDAITMDLKLEAAIVRDMGFEWIAQSGPVEEIEALVTEYKEARTLQSLKVCVFGPPASGKTTLAKQLCDHYKLHHIHKDGVIEQSLKDLTEKASLLHLPEDERPEDTEDAEAAKADLEGLKQQLEDNNGQYEDEQIMKWFKERLETPECKNHGYVLDGFPTTEDEAKELFAAAEDAEDPDAPNPITVPEFVFALDASDEFLKERVMNLPEDQVAGTQNAEETFVKRLAMYREMNGEDETVLNYFDFKEIHPEHLDAAATDSTAPFPRATASVGEPHNYGPTEEEKEITARKAAAEKVIKEKHDVATKALKDAEEAEKNAIAQAEWDEKHAEIKRQEQEALEEESLPLRNFLMAHVMPTLTKGLLEVSKKRPDDPVDFLAEYLFKCNPQID